VVGLQLSVSYGCRRKGGKHLHCGLEGECAAVMTLLPPRGCKIVTAAALMIPTIAQAGCRLPRNFESLFAVLKVRALAHAHPLLSMSTGHGACSFTPAKFFVHIWCQFDALSATALSQSQFALWSGG
jgi:hypothetical protein